MRYRSSICAAALATGALLAATPSAAQVVDFGKYPDFKGQWVRTGNPNNWLELAGPPPLTPEYQKIFEDITADLKAGGPGNWPSTFCVPAGMPAMMSLYDPAEIIVMPEVTYILISHNDDSYRRIYTDGRDWPTDAEPTFAATRSANGSTRTATASTTCSRSRRASSSCRADTISRACRFTTTVRPSSRSASISTRPTEYALRRDHRDRSRDDAALRQDPEGHPQSESASGLALGRLLGEQHLVRIGNEYYLSADGKLMPSKKDQPPPDLSYFKQTKK